MELLILLGALSLCPWGMRVFSKTSMTTLSAAVLLTGTVLGPSFFAYDVGVTLSLDRVLLLVVVGVFAVRFWEKVITLRPFRRADLLLFALAGWLLLSGMGTDVPAGEESPISRWLSFIAIPLAMYVLARYANLNLNDLNLVLKILVVFGVYLGITGLLEVSKLHALVFPKYIVDPENWEFFGRARGPILNPAGNGILLSMGFGASLYRCIHGKEQLEKVTYGIAVAIISAGILATLTRSAWLGAGVVGLLFAALYLRRFIPAAALLAAAGIVVVSTAGDLGGLVNLKRDKHLSAADSAKSMELRPVLAKVAWEMFKDKPLLGHGYGGYRQSYLPYVSDRYHNSLEIVRPYIQHNIILSLLVDSGLLAMSLFLVWLAIATRLAWRLATKAERPELQLLGFTTLSLLIAYMINGMFHDVSVMPMLNNFVFFMSGITISAATGVLRPDGTIGLPRTSEADLPKGLQIA